jgi:hypothetical protein
MVNGSFPDSLAAVVLRDRLRSTGFPAWILAVEPSQYRVAVGAGGDPSALEQMALDLNREGVDGFSVESVPAGCGIPLPHSLIRDRDRREAWLLSVGPPGFTADELWLTEKLGARQIRLIRAMISLPLR